MEAADIEADLDGVTVLVGETDDEIPLFTADLLDLEDIEPEPGDFKIELCDERMVGETVLEEPVIDIFETTEIEDTEADLEGEAVPVELNRDEMRFLAAAKLGTAELKDFDTTLEDFDIELEDFEITLEDAAELEGFDIELDDFEAELEDFEAELEDFDAELEDFDEECALELFVAAMIGRVDLEELIIGLLGTTELEDLEDDIDDECMLTRVVLGIGAGMPASPSVLC